MIHANLKPVFVDIERETYNISIDDLERKITPRTSAILPVNVFGNPARIEDLEAIARKRGTRLLFDSAAAIGSKVKGHILGSYGDAEIFSLSGTKIVTAGEGGVITTDSDDLAAEIDCRRNYGYNRSEKDCLYTGYNGKLNEVSALIALWSLRGMQRNIKWRHKIAEIYYSRLSGIPGIRFQRILEGHQSNFCTFAIEVDSSVFGLDAPGLQTMLSRYHIETLRYFAPPMHKSRAFHQYNSIKLPNTEELSSRVLCLPMHSSLSADEVHKVCGVIHEIREKLQLHSGISLPHNGVAHHSKLTRQRADYQTPVHLFA